MRWTKVIFFAPAAALAAVWGCGGAETAATATSGSGGAATTTTGSTGGAAATASGTGGDASVTSSGNGGSSAASSGSSSSASSSATGSTPCVWAAINPCGQGMYCDAPTCQQGTCVPSGGVETGDKAPVCGCNNVTYWNASVAKKKGQSVASNAACAPGKTCGGFANLKCPGAAVCSYQQVDSSGCNIADGSGTCFEMPDVCPPVVIGSKTRACGAGKCEDECNLIKKSTSYYTDSTCPQ